MPYMMKKQDGQWCVFKEDKNGEPDGEALGCHDKKGDASDQMAALYASADKEERVGWLAQLQRWTMALFNISPRPAACQGCQPKEAPKRTIALGQIFDQVYSLFGQMPEWPMLRDIYEDAGNLFAIASLGGKLYQYPLMVEGTTVQLGQGTEVEMQFVPITQRTQVLRMADGTVRWLSVACSAVLNRVAQIDSTALFDCMVERFNSGKVELAYRDIYHLGKRARIGTVDFLARSGYLLLAGGTYDKDNPLAEVDILAHEAAPDSFGESIAYDPDPGNGELVEVTPGVRVWVFSAGTLGAITTCFKNDACAYFTRTEVTRTMDAVLAARIKEMFTLAGKTEADANAWIESIDGQNRTIDDKQLIARAQAAAGQQPAQQPAQSQGEAQGQPDPATPPAQPAQRFELDETALDAIAQRVAALLGQPLQAASAMVEQVAQLSASVQQLSESARVQGEQLAQRVQALEKTDEEKQRQYLQNSAAGRPAVQLYASQRPREVNKNQAQPAGQLGQQTFQEPTEALARINGAS